MKKLFICIMVIPLLFILIPGPFTLSAQEVVTFQVDLTDYKMEPGTAVGIRGDMAPLTWDKSLPMADPDGDSIYTVKVIFNEGKPGDRIMYKYMVGEIWDNDRFGPYGNRVVALSTCPQVLPVDKWDVLNSFALEFLLSDASESEIYPWIYLISKGKKEGLTAEEVTVKYTEFWGMDYGWLERPEMLMMMEQFNQAKYPDGYFEEMENIPGKVVYRIRKNWAGFIEIRGEGGNIMGVTGEDVTSVSKAWLKYITGKKGWSFDWKDEGKFAVITIEAP